MLCHKQPLEPAARLVFCPFGNISVHRLYHPGIKKHLYTKDENEKNILSKSGWQYEGIAWNVEK